MKTNDPERVVLRSFKIYRSHDHQSLSVYRNENIEALQELDIDFMGIIKF
jgi:hypothetical protein